MMMLMMQYSQPRPATFDPKVVIYEKKELVFEDVSYSATKEFIESFLNQEPMICGSETHYRKLNFLRPHLVPQPGKKSWPADGEYLLPP